MKRNCFSVRFSVVQCLALIVGALILNEGRAVAQDIHFSQFDETPLQLNPANAGVKHDVEIITNYKNQWQSVGSPYKTFALSADFKLLKKKKNNLGIGIDFFNDKAGDANLSSNQVNLSLCGIVPLNDKNKLSGGIMTGFGQRSINLSGLSWGEQYDGTNYNESLPTGELSTASNFTFFDLGAGIEYSYSSDEMYISANNARKFTIGVSMFHPNRPAYSFYGESTERLHTKYVLHGDASLGIQNSNLVLKPSYIVFMQGAVTEVTPGMMFQYIIQEGSKYTGHKKPAAFSLGGYYRLKDAFIAEAKFEFANYAIGFSYDVNLSKLKTVTSSKGGFEISLRFISPSAFAFTRQSAKFY